MTSDGSRTFTYDVENRLVAASGAANAALRYDPLGRLYEVTGGSGTTRFLYDGDALVGEYVGGAMTRRHVHNFGADLPLISYAGATLSQPHYLHADHLGWIVAISDPWGNGTVNAYDEWGIPNAANQGRFQYTGQTWLPELGMYYYKARMYSPTLGRFMQTDPIGYDDQLNLYAYVGNDPVNATDPSGTCGTGSRLPGDAIGCMVAFDYADQGGGRSPPQGPLQGRSAADQRSAQQINDFARNPRASFTQTMRGTTLTVTRNGNAISGTVSKDGRTLRFTGRLAEVPGRRAVRIDGLTFRGPRGTVVSSAPSTITIYTHRDGNLHVSTNQAMVIRIWLGIINLVNEPAGDRRLNE